MKRDFLPLVFILVQLGFSIATGGLAPLFKNGSDLIDELEPNLTLLGLRLVYDRQVQAQT